LKAALATTKLSASRIVHRWDWHETECNHLQRGAWPTDVEGFMFTESPLNIILSKWVILIGYVEVLESGPTHGQRYDALRAALELVCHDVSELINERYLQLHRAATTKAT
jgi:hypothetical protein